jgi:glycosyltransferase involved in cell wall biosynthesis
MEDKKTILYLITQSELGGAQKYVFDLAYYFREIYNVKVAFGEQGDDGELANKLKNAGIEYFVLKNLKRPISWQDDWRAYKEIKKLMQKLKPDVVHLNSSKISILGSLAAKSAKIKKVVYTAHGWVFNEPLPEKQKNFYRWAEKWTAKYKHHIICVSSFDFDVAIKEKIAPREKLSVIHNGIDFPNYYQPEQARKILGDYLTSKKFFIDEKEIIIGSIGNLYKTKGFEFLISAVKILIDNGIKLKCIIIGEGQERKELENWIGQMYLHSYVLLAGRIPNAAQLLSAFDCYVCSSVKEGLSYTLIEAMAAGLPIVATQVGGNSELITNNQEGMLVDSANPEQIAQAVLKILSNNVLAGRLGVNAVEKARNEFTSGKMIKMTEEVYLK